MSRRLLVLLCVAWLQPASAAAEWLFTPFLGYKFAGTSRPTPTFVDLEASEGRRKITIGGSVALLSDDILGVEADFSFIPGYFQGASPGNRVVSSAVTTLTGNIIIAVPLSITQYSLRPYLIGGLGLIRAKSDVPDDVALFAVSENLFGVNVGGGAIGALSDRTSLRFELRNFTNLGGEESAVGFGRARLSFWRATVGIAFRY